MLLLPIAAGHSHGDLWLLLGRLLPVRFILDSPGRTFNYALLAPHLVNAGMGIRAQRFAAIVDDGVVKHIAYEPPGGKITVTGAEAVLAAL